MMKISKVVIPVAGLGIRFLPVTKSIPKEMLPIVDEPTIMLLLKEAKNAGIKDVLFIISNRKKCIKDFFKDDLELEKLVNNEYKKKINEIKEINNNININYIVQEEPLGSGDAIYYAKEFINNEPFAVMFGDDLIKGENALKELINKYNKVNANIIGINKIDTKDICKYGIISFSDEKTLELNNIVEKPNIFEAPSNYAGLGRYIFNFQIFECIEELKKYKKNDYKLTDAMKILMKKQKFYGCIFTGKYFDIGSKLGYIKANIEYGLENTEFNNELIEYIKNLRVK